MHITPFVHFPSVPTGLCPRPEHVCWCRRAGVSAESRRPCFCDAGLAVVQPLGLRNRRIIMTQTALARTLTDIRARAQKSRTATGICGELSPVDGANASPAAAAPDPSVADPAVRHGAPAAIAPEAASGPFASARQTKADQLITLLRRPEGTTIAQMCAVSGWLPHSVRGFLAGTLRKRRGIVVVSEKTDAGRVYRIAVGEANA